SAPAGANTASQWVWDRPARRARRWTWRHTALGYAIHHASSVFCATGFGAGNEAVPPPRKPIARSAAMATLAYVVDYHVVPRRLSPGFEHRIGPRGMLATYASFALGLYVAERLRKR